MEICTVINLLVFFFHQLQQGRDPDPCQFVTMGGNIVKLKSCYEYNFRKDEAEVEARY